MSIGAMIYRAFDLGMIDGEERSVLYRNLTRRGWRGPLQEPFDDPSEMPVERPRMIRRGMRVVLELGTSKAAIKAALNLPEKEIEQIAGLDPGFFRPVADVHSLAVAKRPALKAIDVESSEVIEFPHSKKRP